MGDQHLKSTRLDGILTSLHRDSVPLVLAASHPSSQAAQCTTHQPWRDCSDLDGFLMSANRFKMIVFVSCRVANVQK